MTRSPIVWSLVQRFGTDALSFTTLLVLAWLLRPADFGVVGIAAVWVGLISAFSELGLGAAVIQRTSIAPHHLSSTFFLNLGMGITFAVIGVAASGLIARLFRAPEVQPVVAVLSLGFVLTSLSQTQQALAYRELRLRDIAVRDVLASAVGGASAIILAIRGFGVWSLVVQSIASSATASLLLWRMSPWRPRIREASLQSIRELWGYSSSILLFNLVKFVSQNTDRVLVGRFLGAPMLGVYNFAHKVVVYPSSALAGALGQYQFPRFSRLQEDLGEVRSSYLLFNRASAGVVLPALLVIAALSPVFVPTFFGSEWLAAVPLMRIFTLVALAVVVMSPMGTLMKSLGRPTWLFWWSIGFTVVATALLWLGTSWGLVGAVAGLASAYVISLPVVYLLTSKLLNLTIGEFLRPFVPSTVACVLAIAVVVAVLAIIPGSLPSWLVPASGLGLVVYCFVILRMDRPFLAQVLEKLRTR